MKKKVTLFIQAIKYVGTEEVNIDVHSFPQTTSGLKTVVNVDEVEVEIELPEFTQEQFTNGHIEQLRELKKSFMAEVQLKVQSIDEQIESLLAIEHKGAE